MATSTGLMIKFVMALISIAALKYSIMCLLLVVLI
jgi:hypothetical protein